MTIPLESRRIVIAGASSLLGAELKSLLEESRFAASDFRLLDEEIVAGTLTEAGGQAAVIQPVEEDSFARAWVIFFTGSAVFTRSNFALAARSGANLIDLSGELAVQPVSAAGKPGIEELESQTGQLLSFQSVGKQVFDAQVAYAMLDRFGPSSSHSLSATLGLLRREVRAALPGSTNPPAIQLLHAPVFYGTTVTACAFMDRQAEAADIARLCSNAGFSLADTDGAPSNVTSAGEIALQLATPSPDSAARGAFWFWAAADNLRLPASN